MKKWAIEDFLIKHREVALPWALASVAGIPLIAMYLRCVLAK